MIVNHYAGSDEMGMEYRPYYLAKRWTEMGHKVVILAGSHSHLRQHNPQLTEKIEEKNIDGITYCFFKTPPYDKNNNRRFENVGAFLFGVWNHAKKLAQRYQPDVVIASSTYPFDIYPSEKIAKAAGAKLVFEIHDLWPLSITELHGYKDSHPMVVLVKMAMKKAIKTVDGVVSIIEYGNRYLDSLHLTPKHYQYIGNGIEQSTMISTQLPQSHIAQIQQQKEQGKFVVLYLGGIAAGNALDTFVNLANTISSDIVFVLVGKGMDQARLKELVGSNERILFLDAVPKTQVQAVLSQADCLYIGAIDSGLYQYGVSMNKIYDYMYAGKPIVFAVDNHDNAVTRAGCGVIISPEDEKELEQAILHFKNMSPQERIEIGNRGHAYCIEHHDYGVLAQRFIDEISKL